MGKRKRETLLKFACWIVPLIAFAMTFLFVRKYFIYTVDSDHASELILGRLLAKEGGVLSSNWYYSTELRALNTNLFYGFFFRFTDHWHTVRMLGYAAMYLLLLLAAWFLGRITGNEKNSLLLGALLLLPMPGEYFVLFLNGGYYLPYIILSVAVFAMGEGFVRTEKKWVRILILCISSGLALFSGMGGARQLIVLYVPIVAASGILFFQKTIKERKKWFVFSLAVFAGALVGFGLNLTILRKNYSFMTWGHVNFAFPTFSRLEAILKGFLAEFGFSSGGVFYGPSVIRNLVFVLWLGLTVTAVVYAIRRRDEVESVYLRMTVFFLAAVVAFTVLYLFTDMYYQDRYNLPIVMMSIPLLACFFKDVRWKKRVSGVVMAVLIGTSFLNSALFYQQRAKADSSKDFREVSQYLLQEDYYNGYASFWNANVLTELSDGAIEVWDWIESWDENFSDIDQTYKWLQLKSHDTDHPSGKVFMLLTPDQFDHNAWDRKVLEQHVCYVNDSFKVLGFADYDEAKKATEAVTCGGSSAE